MENHSQNLEEWSSDGPFKWIGLSSYATSIVVSGNDVYVAGEKVRDQAGEATYWKNGVAVNLQVVRKPMQLQFLELMFM